MLHVAACGTVEEARLPHRNFQLCTKGDVALSDTADLDNAEAARVEAARRIGVLLSEHAHRL